MMHKHMKYFPRRNNRHRHPFFYCRLVFVVAERREGCKRAMSPNNRSNILTTIYPVYLLLYPDC